MKLIFLGTPDFAVPSLKRIAESNHQILAVVTQPDKPRNRGILTPSPVKQQAIDLGLKVLQYDRISREGLDDIKAIKPDIMVTCAFGQILSRDLLAVPKFGVINEHASLLPKYRGSSPIQWSIINGEKQTGVTIMKTAYEVDSGDILFADKLDILENETAGDLFERLSILASESIIKALDLIENGNANYTPQNHNEATFCKMLTKADGVIDWSRSAQDIKNFVRGMNPWPCAFTTLNGEVVKIHKVSIVENYNTTGKCGEVLRADKNGLIVSCGNGTVNIDIIQMPNSKKMSAKDYLAGHSIKVNSIFC
ncbi:MAG: methionyl-tRNA formyltransferase [Clostridia bacterium]|nr:methionyl-tRNA formyltransferase [Clostridia bacterium]